MSSPLITNIAARSRQSLNGTWRYLLDPYRAGYEWILGGRHPRGWYLDRDRVDPGSAQEYDFDASPTIAVPGDWNSQAPELSFYEGSVWYRRRFHASGAPGRRQFVWFGAVNQRARVFVEGEELAEHEGGFGPFNVEITDALAAAPTRQRDERSLVVLADNTRRPEAIPAMGTDWFNDGGITREVWLVDVPQTFIRDAVVSLDPSAPDQLIGQIELDGPDAAGAVVRMAIAELDITIEATTDGDGRASFAVAGAPARWSPDSPTLYDVVFQSEHDELADRVGFRTIETRGHEILLNGEPIFLKGIGIHAQAPNRPDRAQGDDDAHTLLRWAQDLGCNFVRLSHYQHDEAMVRACDEMGLLAWGELPVYWVIDWENPDTLANAKSQLDELIIRDRNRASVIIWSLANETPPDPARTDFLAALAVHARALDSTRLLSTALFTMPTGDGRHHLDDPIGHLVDVLGCNEYYGWYYGKNDDMASIEWTTEFDKPVIATEFGAGARAGHHGPAEQRWTEEFQVAVYEAQLAMLGRVPFIAGTSPWILNDFRTPRRVLPGIQDGWNRKGLVSDRGERKLAFETLRAFYETR